MARIDIKGDIVINEYAEFYRWFGWDCVCPAYVQDVLANTPSDEAVDVYINSGGGHVMAGQEIYSALRADPRVTIHIDGMACSAASIIAMAGTSYISPVAMLMIHNVSGGAEGDYHEMEKAKAQLKQMNEALANAYAVKTGMDMQELLKLMDRETWLTANQCLEYGFIDHMEAPAVQMQAINSVNVGLRLTPEMMEKAKQEMAAKDSREKEKNQLIEDLYLYGV